LSEHALAIHGLFGRQGRGHESSCRVWRCKSMQRADRIVLSSLGGEMSVPGTGRPVDPTAPNPGRFTRAGSSRS
jgi:hypothetical protein